MTKDESKNDKFRRLGKRRCNVALKRIEMIHPLANRKVYAYENHEAEELINALDGAVEALRKKFSAETATMEFDFSPKQDPLL